MWCFCGSHDKGVGGTSGIYVEQLALIMSLLKVRGNVSLQITDQPAGVVRAGIVALQSRLISHRQQQRQ